MTFYKSSLIFLLILFFGSLDWIILPIPFTTKNMSFMISELIILFSLIYLYYLYKKRIISFQDLDFKKNILIFIGYLCIFTFYHVIFDGFDMAYFSYPRISICAITLFILFEKKLIDKKSVSAAINIFLAVLNILQLIHFLLNHSLRTSEVANNINIYICCNLILLPFLFYQVIVKNNKLSLFNSILTLSFIPFSGSRSGFGLSIIVLLALFFIFLKKLNVKLVVTKFLIIVFGSILSIFLLFLGFGDYYAQSSVMRATFFDQFFRIENDDLRVQTNNIILEENITITQENATPQDSDKTNSDDTEQLHESQEMERTSDLIRKNMWYAAVNKVKENPILGTGIMTYDVNMNNRIVQQGPHNFILELLLCYGVIGSLIYTVILYKMYKTTLKKGNKVLKLIILTSLFAYSFFQPTFVSYLIQFISISVLFAEFSLE